MVLTRRNLPTYNEPMASVDVFAVLANPVRRKILEVLLRGPSSANALADRFVQQRPAVSEHLQVLRKARLVRCERRGRERRYSVDPARLAPVQLWLAPFEKYWRERINALDSVLTEEKRHG
jgi:DNA-binding transcriptional ArsR family regulator